IIPITLFSTRSSLNTQPEDELSQPWIYEETDPFTPRVRYFELPKKSRMPNNVKTYYGCDDLKDYLKIFQAAAKVEGWAMPTWFHMFNSTLIGSARNHQPRAHQMMHDNIPISVDEIMRVTITFLRGEVATSNQVRKKAPPAWKQWEVGRKQNFVKMGDFGNQQRSEQRHDKFILLTKSPKEILALEKGKFKAPPPMTTHVEKRNNNKFYEIHKEVGNDTNECVHPKRPRVRKIQAVSSTAHEMLKFPVSGGIITLFSSMIIPLECTMVSRPEAQPSDIIQAVEERIKVAIHPQHLEQTIVIGSTLTEEGRKALYDLVRPSLDENVHGFQKLKQGMPKRRLSAIGNRLKEFPTLTALIEREELTVNLAAAREAINAVLITEREAKQMQSTLLAMPYKILSRLEVARRLQKYSIELGKYDIQYRPRRSYKGQILADFIVERLKDDPLDTPMEAKEELLDPWTLFTNGSSCVDGFRVGLILTNPKGAEFTYALRFRFDTTNNEAEYEALIGQFKNHRTNGCRKSPNKCRLPFSG
nr:hypothetical protein [Tanacetum cinerariifolium]